VVVAVVVLVLVVLVTSTSSTSTSSTSSTSGGGSRTNLERFIDEYHAFDAMEEFPAYFASKTVRTLLSSFVAFSSMVLAVYHYCACLCAGGTDIVVAYHLCRLVNHSSNMYTYIIQHNNKPLATDHVKFEQNYTFQEPSQFPPLVYDSIMGIGIAACQAQEEFFTGQELLNEFFKLDFEGASGTVRMDPVATTKRK
jgi:hypothetical protein